MIKTFREWNRLPRMLVDNDRLIVEYQDEPTSSFRLARVAFVKQDCYQDLWIGGEDEPYQDLIRSTQMRVGPIGLITLCQCKFFILKNSPCSNEYNYFQRQSSLSFRDLSIVQQYRAEMINASLELTSSRFHSDYSQPLENINWSNFDLVVSINSPVPYKVRQLYKKTLWLCMPGEGICQDYELHKLRYDGYLSHNWAKYSKPRRKVYLDFPYTFIGAKDLETVDCYGQLKTQSQIYLEINSGECHQRPPRLSSLPEASLLLERTGMKVLVHQGSIDAHLIALKTSKYFIKIGGRPTRGNAFMEAISAGTLVLMGHNDCFGNVCLPKQSYYSSIEQLCILLKELEDNALLYQDLLMQQKQCMVKYGIVFPLQQVAYAYNNKHTLLVEYSRLIELLSLLSCALVLRIKTKFRTYLKPLREVIRSRQ